MDEERTTTPRLPQPQTCVVTPRDKYDPVNPFRMNQNIRPMPSAMIS